MKFVKPFDLIGSKEMPGDVRRKVCCPLLAMRTCCQQAARRSARSSGVVIARLLLSADRSMSSMTNHGLEVIGDVPRPPSHIPANDGNRKA